MINIDQISYKRLKLIFSEKGYKFFTEPFDMNVFGIRSSNVVAGEFDDYVGVEYVNGDHDEKLFLFKATTDSGLKYLLNPLHLKGAAILLEGQHLGAYKIGIHGRTWASGGYEAMEQVSPMEYVRDNNKNNILGDSVAVPFSGILKTNIHRASKWEILDKIGGYSAGCQVIQDPEDFKVFMAICKQQIEHGLGNSFSYTLLNEKDFNG